MGPSANLYDASSNVLRRVLTFPNCNTFSSAQFIGRSGRYLAVVSVWDVVLWDLPTQSVTCLCYRRYLGLISVNSSVALKKSMADRQDIMSPAGRQFCTASLFFYFANIKTPYHTCCDVPSIIFSAVQEMRGSFRFPQCCVVSGDVGVAFGHPIFQLCGHHQRSQCGSIRR